MPERQHPGRGLFQSKAGSAPPVFGTVATFFLIIEHQAHVFGILPHLLVLARPPLHLFMHGGHTHEHAARSAGKSDGESGGTEARYPEREKREQS